MWVSRSEVQEQQIGWISPHEAPTHAFRPVIAESRVREPKLGALRSPSRIQYSGKYQKYNGGNSANNTRREVVCLL